MDFGIIRASDRNIISEFEMTSEKGFPKSKKLYIRLFDLGFTMLDLSAEESGVGKIAAAEDFQLTDAEWFFDLDLPEKFYLRESMELVLKDTIPDLEIETVKISETGLILKAKSQDILELITAGKDMKAEEFTKKRNDMIYISDGEGNRYYDLNFGTTSSRGIKAIYDLNKKDLEKKLYLNFQPGDTLYTSELIQK